MSTCCHSVVTRFVLAAHTQAIQCAQDAQVALELYTVASATHRLCSPASVVVVLASGITICSVKYEQKCSCFSLIYSNFSRPCLLSFICVYINYAKRPLLGCSTQPTSFAIFHLLSIFLLLFLTACYLTATLCISFYHFSYSYIIVYNMHTHAQTHAHILCYFILRLFGAVGFSTRIYSI